MTRQPIYQSTSCVGVVAGDVWYCQDGHKDRTWWCGLVLETWQGVRNPGSVLWWSKCGKTLLGLGTTVDILQSQNWVLVGGVTPSGTPWFAAKEEEQQRTED